jgi:hypothetical protein
VSSTPDSRRSATATLPRIVVTETIVGTEELVSLLPHTDVVDPRQLPVPLDQLLSGQTQIRE